MQSVLERSVPDVLNNATKRPDFGNCHTLIIQLSFNLTMLGRILVNSARAVNLIVSSHIVISDNTPPIMVLTDDGLPLWYYLMTPLPLRSNVISWPQFTL